MNNSAIVFPPAVRPDLSAMAEIGIVVFMFLVGWELEGAIIKARRAMVVSISLCAVALPFVCGVAVAEA